MDNKKVIFFTRFRMKDVPFRMDINKLIQMNYIQYKMNNARINEE